MSAVAQRQRRTGAQEDGSRAGFEAHAWAGLDPCVHCGFCLPACPTYEVTADEADSPRGRIVLLRALARGEMPADDPALAYHLDRCLGCRGCESACPSGVTFGPALEAARALQLRERGLPAAARIMLWLLGSPAQRPVWFVSRLLRATGLPRRMARAPGGDPPRLRTLLGMLAATEPRAERGPTYAIPNPQSPIPCILFKGCVMDGLFGHVHRAAATALAANGLRVVDAPGQRCCGALAAHAGADRIARRLARANVAALEAVPDAMVAVDSAGCGAMLKEYGSWLAEEPAWSERARAVAGRVRDVAEVLAERGPVPGVRPVRLRVAYDAPCHLLHAQRVDDEPRRLLAAVPGLEIVPLEGGERCCGSAGLFALLEPRMAQDVLAPKLDAIARAAPDVVATGNPGCLMHIGAGALARGLRIEVRHPVELLAWSYAP